MSDLQTILVHGLFPEKELARIREAFKTVYYYPTQAEIPVEELEAVQVLFCHGYTHIPACVQSLDQLPSLTFIQNSATGIEKLIRAPAITSALPERLNQIAFANAAGGYSVQMAQFILNYITGLYNSIPSMIHWQRTERRWAEPSDIMAAAGRTGIYGSKTIAGKTFGLLGYGSLGREFARVCTIFPQSRIIAANSEGKAKPDDTYAMPGTGDPEGKLPAAYYSTNDPKSLDDFLSECDVLICSLPSTSKTTGLLDAHRLGLMKPEGIFINVGRGSLIETDEIIKAVDRPNGLLGAAIDVTEPEPLTAGHPIWDHPRVMITPHLSGETEDELIASTNVLLANTAKIRVGKPYFNPVSFTAGY